MYAALRADKKRLGEDAFRPVKTRDDDGVGVTAAGKAQSSAKWGSEKNIPGPISNDGRSRNASVTRCQTANTPEVVDEWELLDETLGDARHYFSHHTNPHPSPNDGIGRLWSGQNFRGQHFQQENHLSAFDANDRSKSAQGTYKKPDNGGSDWKSLPDYGSKGDHWSGEPDKREQKQQSAFSTESSENKDDDEPLTTLDSIIAAAKRMSTSRLTSTSSGKGQLMFEKQPSWHESKRSPYFERVGSLNSCGFRSNDHIANGLIQAGHGQSTSLDTAALISREAGNLNLQDHGDYPNDDDEDRLEDLSDDLYLRQRPSTLARGFTWASSDSTSFDFASLRRIRRLPQREKSFLGSLDSEPQNY